ncbi:hypothetical protein [Paenalcaligenes suwonensis]|uniref:hypothetical protein n=1 Tax=Paenalcaligenes suwonensis TaxID=1202713 RepID=UPI00140D0F68|nr:hypothetical protein [Paenalcaligenes suwonensis]NHC62201.1 hypothetical protein [Paenalcaligenes suwonensis]
MSEIDSDKKPNLSGLAQLAARVDALLLINAVLIDAAKDQPLMKEKIQAAYNAHMNNLQKEGRKDLFEPLIQHELKKFVPSALVPPAR